MIQDVSVRRAWAMWASAKGRGESRVVAAPRAALDSTQNTDGD